jgi:hypothetical protein
MERKRQLPAVALDPLEHVESRFQQMDAGLALRASNDTPRASERLRIKRWESQRISVALVAVER